MNLSKQGLLSCIILFHSYYSTAYAEDQLFPTFILDKGTFDATIDINHQNQSTSVISNKNEGTQSEDITSEAIQMRYGLGDNWLIGLAVPYDTQYSVKTEFSNPVAHFLNTKLQGSQNPSFWAKYGVNQNNSLWSFSGELLVSPDTTNKTGNAYEMIGSTGWKANDTLSLYGQLRGYVNDDDSTANRIAVKAGAYDKWTNSFTLIPHLGVTQFQSTAAINSFSQYDLGLSAHISIMKDTYLIPDATYFSNEAIDNKSNTFRSSSSNGRSFTVGLYHAF